MESFDFERLRSYAKRQFGVLIGTRAEWMAGVDNPSQKDHALAQASGNVINALDQLEKACGAVNEILSN